MPTGYCYPVKLMIADLICAENKINRLLTLLVGLYCEISDLCFLHSLCTAVTLDEAHERTSVSWMYNPCSGHMDRSQIWVLVSDWTVLYLNNL